MFLMTGEPMIVNSENMSTKILSKMSLNRRANKSLVSMSLCALLMLPVTAVVETSFVGAQQAQAQDAPQRKTKRVDSIRQKHVKAFEAIAEAQEVEDYATMTRNLDKLSKETDLNNLEAAYVAQFKGNICFTQDRLDCALREFKKVIRTPDGLSEGFYNNMLYVVAQVYFSQENYSEALKYAQQWIGTQEIPSPDGLILIGQAHYQLKQYDKALPNVQKAISLYEELGTKPKEGWLNLLSSIYRQKRQYREMLPVVKSLVQLYPKKRYLLTLGGIYNELDDQARMTAMYQALYDQNLLTAESELVTLASLNMSQENPYVASQIMQKGMDGGVIKKELKNYRVLAQALYLSREYDKALDPLGRAAKLSSDGKLYNQLGQSLISLNRWKEAEAALNNALKKGKLRDTGQAIISLGLVQFEQKKFEAASNSFNRALRYDKVSGAAQNWLNYVKSEVQRLKELDAPIPEINTSVEPETV